MKNMNPKIAKHPKIHLHMEVVASTPPKTGPIAVKTCGPVITRAIPVALTSAWKRSTTVPAAIDVTAQLPRALKLRKAKRAAICAGTTARIALDATKIKVVTKNINLLPL